MKISMKLKKGVTLEDALNTLIKIQEIDRKIEEDLHTNKHYELRNGKIWYKGNGVGKYWDYLCSSREAQMNAHEILRI